MLYVLIHTRNYGSRWTPCANTFASLCPKDSDGYTIYQKQIQRRKVLQIQYDHQQYNKKSSQPAAVGMFKGFSFILFELHR